MRNSRRLALMAGAIIATGGLVVGSATSAGAAAQAYNGSAKADALTISVFGTTITSSAATAQLANGSGKATSSQTILQPMNDLSVEQTGDGEQQAAPEKCQGSDLTQIPAINRADLTCGSVQVKIAGDDGLARGIGAQAVIEPTVSNLLSTLQLQEPVQGAVDQIFQEAIDPLVQNLTGNPVGDLVDATTATVQDVLNDVLNLEATARIVVAPALAEVTSANGTVTSHARAQGIRIELLPPTAEATTNGLFPDLAPNEPLITITIGAAEATKVLGQKGVATSALARVHIASTQLTEALGIGDQTDIEVKGGQSVCLLPDPLTVCINVAAATVDADGNPSADGASVQLFKGVNGGIDIATGRAASDGTLTAASQPEQSRELPRTGTGATLPLIGGGLLALAAATRRLSLGRR